MITSVVASKIIRRLPTAASDVPGNDVLCFTATRRQHRMVSPASVPARSAPPDRRSREICKSSMSCPRIVNDQLPALDTRVNVRDRIPPIHADAYRPCQLGELNVNLSYAISKMYRRFSLEMAAKTTMERRNA